MSHLKKPNSLHRKNLREFLQANCLDDGCYTLAVALHRGTGLPMVGLMEEEIIRHVAVCLNPVYFWDARGVFEEREFGLPFGLHPPYVYRTVTEVDLGAIKPTNENGVRFLMNLAQSVWPNLPWRDDTPAQKVKVFMEELEQLSRKHGLWIRGPFPGTPPVVSLAGGDESYEFQPTVDSSTWTFDRVFGRAGH